MRKLPFGWAFGRWNSWTACLEREKAEIVEKCKAQLAADHEKRLRKEAERMRDKARLDLSVERRERRDEIAGLRAEIARLQLEAEHKKAVRDSRGRFKGRGEQENESKA